MTKQLLLDIDLDTATAIEKVEYMMARLRDSETGCNWDRKQTYKTIAPYTIEEAYEVVDAIEKEDFPHLKEELGDLLLQIVFYAQLATEDGHFNLNDVADVLVDKMVRRHPHVFPAGTLESRIDPADRPSEATIRAMWDKIKREENIEKGKQTGSVLGDVPPGMAPLKRAEKLQKNAAKVGFEWPSVMPVLEKLQEEVAELTEAMEHNVSMSHIEEEMGDVLFCCVNVCRHLGFDPELVMSRANQKFENRFQQMESHLREQGVKIEETNLEVMETGWQAAKAKEKLKG